MMMDGWGPGFEIWGVLMGLAQVAFWVILIVLLVKLFQNRDRGPMGPSSALQLLEERYARGEITREEFVERRSVLLGRSPPASSST